MKFIASAIALVGVAASLSACNTMSGIGEDVQGAGSAVTKASESVKSSY